MCLVSFPTHQDASTHRCASIFLVSRDCGDGGSGGGFFSHPFPHCYDPTPHHSVMYSQ